VLVFTADDYAPFVVLENFPVFVHAEWGSLIRTSVKLSKIAASEYALQNDPGIKNDVFYRKPDNIYRSQIKGFFNIIFHGLSPQRPVYIP
jgi:hypothetical protein